ncbi:MAG: hypothetical protein QOF01_3844, partial [Thermomicrobiales bacterium]|nr:hypothetical protein [Thermomicrobiales bacterium]
MATPQPGARSLGVHPSSARACDRSQNCRGLSEMPVTMAVSMVPAFEYAAWEA